MMSISNQGPENTITQEHPLTILEHATMQGEGPSWFGPRSLCSIRSVCVGSAFLAATVLLVWVYREQSHINLCTELAARSNHKDDRQIKVVIQMPTDNKTKEYQGDAKKKWDYNWDKKSWKQASDANGVPVRTIILVRHGKYDLSTGHLIEIGRQQANITGRRLRDLNMPYARIIHSPMARAVETANIIHGHLPHLPLIVDPMIEEGGPVPPDPTVSYWGLPDRGYFVDGPRIEAAFRKHFYRADKFQEKDSYEILVGHANIFRYLILRAVQFPADAWMRVFIPHASISLLHINPDGTVTLTKFGDSGHLPPQLVTI